MSQTNLNAPAPATPSWLTAPRILLGLILLWRSIVFIRDTVQLERLIQDTGIGTFSQSASTLATLVAILTLACGFFITIGLFTRLAALVQIPILLVAVFFVNINNIDRSPFELVLSIVVLALLVLFAVKGSGNLSGDAYFKMKKRRNITS